MSEIGSSNSTKSIILPTNITESLGTIATVLEYLSEMRDPEKKDPNIEEPQSQRSHEPENTDESLPAGTPDKPEG
jgi:hypothetical protein